MGVADGVASVEVDSTVVEVLVETLEEVEICVVTEELVDSTEVFPLVVSGTELPAGVGVELTLAEAGTGVVAVDSLVVLGTTTLEAGTPGVMVARKICEYIVYEVGGL